MLRMRGKKMPLVYLLVAYLTVATIAVIILVNTRPKTSEASQGLDTAQSLTATINALKEYRRTLCEVNTFLLFLAAVSATLLVASSRFSDEAADEQSETQSRLDAIKGEAFRAELTTLETQAADAKTREALAESKLEALRKETAKTLQFVALTNQKAAEATEKAGEVNKAAAELKSENLELEKALMPRVVVITGIKEGKTNIDALKTFAGMQVVLIPIADEEARRAAASIKSALDGPAGAGWKVTLTMPVSTQTIQARDGVSLQLPHSFDKMNRDEQHNIWRARRALAHVLTACGWKEVGLDEAPDDNFPNLLRIVVGFKPPPNEPLK
jgi:hypothetical protein